MDDVVDVLLADVAKFRAAQSYQHSPRFYGLIDRCVAEITRLRAGQFRWIPVSERLPERKDADKHQCVFVTAGGRSPITYQYEFLGTSEYTHWAPIPPLPEQSQGEKDEELWRKYDKENNSPSVGEPHRDSFLAGLKAARGEKP